MVTSSSCQIQRLDNSPLFSRGASRYCSHHKGPEYAGAAVEHVDCLSIKLSDINLSSSSSNERHSSHKQTANIYINSWQQAKL